jgi:hypothetical protein
MEANIQRYTLAANTPLAVSGGIGFGRIIIRVSEDTKMAVSELEVDFNYFLLKADTYIVLDPPNLLATENLWFELDTAISGVVEILRC